MVLSDCTALSLEPSPLSDHHTELASFHRVGIKQNFKTLLLNKYRAEFEQAVYIQVPSLVQLCAKCVASSVPLPSPRSASGSLTQAEVEALLPRELVSYMHEQPWVVTPKARDERWRRMNVLIVLLGELYNVCLIEEEEVLRMLERLCASIEKGMRRNVEPLCRLLVTVGPVLEGRRPRRRRKHPKVGQDALDDSGSSSDDDDDDDDMMRDDAEEDERLHTVGDDSVLARERSPRRCRTKGRRKELDDCIFKAESYLEHVREWKLGERIRFMLQDLLDLRARNWQPR